MNKLNLPDSIDIQIKATHFEPFINKNAVKYTHKAVKDGLFSWTKPFNKPQLVGHDKNLPPIGRIINQEIIKNKKSSDEPPNYIRLTARITDKDAIEKVLDGRFNTVSVGSKSSKVLCSECGQVITEDGLCDHKKGSYNDKGEMIHWNIDQIDYTENSFVNEPADEYAGIENIKIRDQWIPYQSFLDDRKTHLKQISMEDCMLNNLDAKLSTEARNKLPESAFCGPGRSFPAHDKAHVTAGLRLLNRSNFGDATKAKIKACLYRKGKRYGIAPTNDEVQTDPDILVRGVDDEWTTEQRAELEAFFKENPDADLPDATDTNDSADSNKPAPSEPSKIEDMKKPELIALAQNLQKEIETLKKSITDATTANDAKVTELDKKISESTIILNQKEEEINKLLDENAIINKKLRDAIVSNIIDLKMTDNNKEEPNALTEKYSKRSVDSLIDTLSDLRTKNIITNSDKRVPNTLTENKNSDIKSQNSNNEKPKDPFELFDKDRSSTEE